MPNTREKLIEILTNNATCIALGIKSCDECAYGRCEDCYTEALTGHLIANGVTVQKWISVKDRLPEEEGLYLVAVVNDHERRYSKTAWYHGHGNWFLHQKATHWAYLPQPPKGE